MPRTEPTTAHSGAEEETPADGSMAEGEVGAAKKTTAAVAEVAPADVAGAGAQAAASPPGGATASPASGAVERIPIGEKVIVTSGINKASFDGKLGEVLKNRNGGFYLIKLLEGPAKGVEKNTRLRMSAWLINLRRSPRMGPRRRRR